MLAAVLLRYILALVVYPRPPWTLTHLVLVEARKLQCKDGAVPWFEDVRTLAKCSLQAYSSKGQLEGRPALEANQLHTPTSMWARYVGQVSEVSGGYLACKWVKAYRTGSFSLLQMPYPGRKGLRPCYCAAHQQQ